MARPRKLLMTKPHENLPETAEDEAIHQLETQHLQDEDTVAQPASAPAPPGSALPRIEGYEIEGIIGRGGMGIVYRARDTRLNRTVALKTVQVARSSRQTRQRIENEARSLAQLDTPGVVRIFEVGYIDDDTDANARTPFIAMEFVHGSSLDLLNDGNPIDPKRAAQIVYELARTLSICHKQGVVHRDLKPGNVLMASPVEPKLTDFGLARILDEKSRLTKTGEIMGTPAFMAPEQASGVVKNVGAPADIYGLGALLYDLVTGRPPFMAPDPVQTMMQVITREPAPPSTLQPKMPKDLETIILKCLEKKPKHRYESCDALAADLKCFLQNKPISAKPTPAYRKALMWVRRHPAVSSLIGLAALIILGAFAGGSFHINRLQNELDRSQRIIREGRDLSKWLLDDFTTVLQSPKGFTYQRSELADRTQQYLNALLKEAASDRELKADLAYAFTRLAELQGQADTGSLGQTEQARINLENAEWLLMSLGELDSELAQKVFCMVRMQSAGNFLVAQKFDELQAEIDQTRELIDTEDCLLKTGDLLAIRAHVSQMEFEIARAKSDTKRMKETSQRLKKLGDEMITNDVDRNFSTLAIFAWARCSKYWLEPREDPAELLKILNEARQQITDLAGDEPSMDTQNILANLNSDIADIQYRSWDMEGALESYHAALEQWESQYEFDSQNQVVIFNVGHNWQNVGDTHYMLEQYDKCEEAFEKADEYFRRWANQIDKQPHELPEYLYFEGSRANLYMQQGELEKARQSTQAKIDGLKPLANSNVEIRRALGDALMTMGMVQAQLSFVETGNWANGEPHESRKATDRACEAFAVARDHFQAMMDEGVGSDAIQNQLDNCTSVIETLREGIEKIEKLDKGEDL